MSLEKIVAEAMAGRPLEMKEMFEEEIQARIQARLEEKYVEMTESKDEDDMDEAVDTHHTVDIDHMGGSDPMAKKHNITLKKNKGTEYSHDASGKKKDLQKYLVHHYNDKDDAEDAHPEVFKESYSEEELKSFVESLSDYEFEDMLESVAELEEGPFKGIGKMLMKRKLAKTAAKADQAANDQAGQSIQGKLGNISKSAGAMADKRLGDAQAMRARAIKAKARLSKPKEAKFDFNKR